jgi:hypothetical protein
MRYKISAFLAVCIPTFVYAAQPSQSVFAAKVQKLGAVELTGWARLKYEVILYEDTDAMNDPGDDKYPTAVFPRCVSGVFADQSARIETLRTFDGQKVTIKGEIVDYKSLPDEGGFLARKAIGKSAVINNCFGKNVLRIESIKLASD